MRVAEIAGAGLSGLALACRLAQLGWTVNLHERSPELRMFGAGIWLWENGLKSLKLIGAHDAAVRRARYINEWRVSNGRGDTLASRPMTGDDKLLLPPRADLYEALIERAQALGVNIFTSSPVASVRKEGVLVLESGEERKADLVIAADGAHSRLREGLQATRFIDYGIEIGVRMMIDSSPDDPEDIIHEYWNGPWRLLYNPCTDGQTYVFLSVPIESERGKRLPIDQELWLEKFPAAAGIISRFGDVAGRWDRIVNVRCRQWSDGKVALVGDAAHAMPPNLGQAANMAFTNAMALAEHVTNADDIPTALREWEKSQRPITNHVQRWSYVYGFVVGKWPEQMESLRSDFLRFVSNMEWFENGLNRGARFSPAGYLASLASKLTSNKDE
ncbi:FAD-dependent monooxygenase [Caballeronia sp. LjRoot34]|uniref:FAD-dependent oxidoreductase n=1 Tax=Caballeronia sp. LjRoot34 TaxID=3342325 RepID=UPI003ECFEB68